MSLVNCNCQPEPAVRTTDLTVSQGTTCVARNLKLSQVTTGVLRRPAPHHPSPPPRKQLELWTQPTVGGGRREAATVSMTEPPPTAWTPLPLRSSWRTSVPCLFCLHPCGRCTLLGGSLAGELSSLLPRQRTISLQRSFRSSSDLSGSSHADALEPPTNQVVPGCQQHPSPRCVRPEGLGRELRPPIIRAPVSPNPGTRPLPCPPLL